MKAFRAAAAHAAAVHSRTSWVTTWGLEHDRYQVHHHEGGVSSHPAYGYVKPAGIRAGGRAVQSLDDDHGL